MAIVFKQPLKPPTTLLLLCSLLFVCSTLIMAIYIQHAHLVPNPEISRTWEKFLHGLSGMDLCTRIPEKWPVGVNPAKHFSDLVTPAKSSEVGPSVTVQASVKLKRELTRLPQGIVAVTGRVPLGEWARLCYDLNDEEESFVTISFVVPENLTQTQTPDVCVILTGPRNIIPLSQPSSICVPPLIDLNRTRLGMLSGRADQTIFNTIRKSKDQCDNGSLLQLTYNSTTDYIIYLSPIERERITWNLQVVSAGSLLISLTYVAFRILVTRRSVIVADDSYAVPQIT